MRILYWMRVGIVSIPWIYIKSLTGKNKIWLLTCSVYTICIILYHLHMDHTSLFEHTLPEAYSDFQVLHNQLRNGDYWRLSQEQAESAYLSALCHEATTPFSEAIQKILDWWTSINSVVAYIQQEFSGYSSLMSERFNSYNKMYSDFSDKEKAHKITQRLAKVDLDRIEIKFSHQWWGGISTDWKSLVYATPESFPTLLGDYRRTTTT